MGLNHDNHVVVTKAKKKKSKPLWNDNTHMVFLELCLNEVRNGNKPTGYFNKIGKKNLEKHMKECTGLTIDQKQIKYHWDSMKTEWKLYDRLMRIESGIGWDPVRKTIDASADWWDEKIKGNKDLAPYKGTNIRYHIPDFRRGKAAASRAPRGAKEIFNHRHSSLRNVIERTFGVWKARWEILQNMHVNYTYETQVNIVLASMAIHNYIRKTDACDEGFNKAQRESYTPNNDTRGRGSSSIAEIDEDTSAQRRHDDLYMSAIRDIIARELIQSR